MVEKVPTSLHAEMGGGRVVESTFYQSPSGRVVENEWESGRKQVSTSLPLGD